MAKWNHEQQKIVDMDAVWAERATAALRDGATDEDFRLVTELYSTEGTIVWPDFLPGYGHKEIEAGWKQANDKFKNAVLKFNPVRITLMSDIATDFGEVNFNGEGGSKYFVVWRLEHGEWKVFSDAWNSNS